MSADGLPKAPALGRWLLGGVLPPRDRESVVDEMEELYRIRRLRDGVQQARRWYLRQAAVFASRMLVERLWRRRGGARHRSGRGLAESHLAVLRLRVDHNEYGGGGGDMRRIAQELRHGLRRLVRSPVFGLVAVLTVAVGIGAFASVFSVVYGVLLKPLPYEEPEELVWVWRDYSAIFDLDRGWLGGPDVALLQEREDVFEDVVAIRSGNWNMTGGPGGAPREVTMNLTSAGFWRLLGVEAVLGRGFVEGEDAPDAPPVVVLSHGLWRGAFAGDPGVVGRSIMLDGTPFTVVGVAPPDFHFVKHASLGGAVAADLYGTLRMDLAAQSPGSGFLAALARLRDDVAPARREAALASAAALVEEAWSRKGLRLWTVPLKEDLVAGVRPALWALLGSAGFLLLILSANLATLFLGRAASRERELAVYAALGAGRGHLVRSVFGEALLVTVAGGILGLGLAYLGGELIATLAPDDLPRKAAIALDGSVVAVALGVTLVMGLAAGLGPAMRVMGGDLMVSIREGATGSGGSLERSRARSALVVAQMALSLMLLVGGGVLARAFVGLVRTDPGFEARGAVTFRIPLDPSRYADSAAVVGFERSLRERLSGMPGVEAVGSTVALPLSGGADQTTVQFPGAPGNSGEKEADEPLVDYLRVSPGYVQAAGLRLLAGRPLQEGDGQTSDSTGLVMIDDVLARRFYPDGGAVGRTVSLGGLTHTIVGVVDQARLHSAHADDRGQVFLPMAMVPTRGLSYALRTAADLDPGTLVPEIRGILREMDPELPLTDVKSLETLVRASRGQERLSLLLVAGFALGALVLATLGIYGVVANSVLRRRREMGLRIALGAEPGEVVGMVLGQGLRLAAAGVVVGLGGAVATSRILEGITVGADGSDPLVYGFTALLVVAVAAAASWIPARGATRIDPVEALRPE